MKKYLLIILLFLISNTSLFPGEIETFRQFLRDINTQALQFKNTASHQNIKKQTTGWDYKIGDTKIFWSWTLTVMPPEWIETPSTCRAVGKKCYLFVADSEWNVNINQTDVDTIMLYLEEKTLQSAEYGVIEMDENLFGPIPDELDNDPKIIVFYSALGSFRGTAFDGYFSGYNQVTEQEAQQMIPAGHSNECEMIYMTCFPLNPSEIMRISVLAHELQHMIHWGQDADEYTWVDEGCAEVAMVHFGLPDPIILFPNNPNNSLNGWNQKFEDYVKVMLFFTYLEEHYGADSLLKEIVAEPANGIVGINNQLQVHSTGKAFSEIFFDWTIANTLDDSKVDKGLYNYELLGLPEFSCSNYHTNYPAQGTGLIKSWAANYIWFYPNSLTNHLDLKVTISEPINVAVLLIGKQGITSIVEKFNKSDMFEISLPEISTDYVRIELVFSNSSQVYAYYTYNISEAPSYVEESKLHPTTFSLTSYPNPFNLQTTMFFNLEQAMPVSFDIFNIRGEKIKTFYKQTFLQSGRRSLVWDGKNDDGEIVGSGVFLCRLKTANREIIRKITLLK